jgi:DNA-binding PadR family transcriptional regulator
MAYRPDEKGFHILIALARRPLHGYAVRQEVEARTEGAVRLWPATLYGLLSELATERLIEETRGPGGPDDDARRRYYALTAAGRRVLEAEAARLERLARVARTSLGFGKASA